jgi:hypothetical protein
VTVRPESPKKFFGSHKVKSKTLRRLISDRQEVKANAYKIETLVSAGISGAPMDYASAMKYITEQLRKKCSTAVYVNWIRSVIESTGRTHRSSGDNTLPDSATYTRRNTFTYGMTGYPESHVQQLQAS